MQAQLHRFLQATADLVHQLDIDDSQQAPTHATNATPAGATSADAVHPSAKGHPHWQLTQAPRRPHGRYGVLVHNPCVFRVLRPCIKLHLSPICHAQGPCLRLETHAWGRCSFYTPAVTHIFTPPPSFHRKPNAPAAACASGHPPPSTSMSLCVRRVYSRMLSSCAHHIPQVQMPTTQHQAVATGAHGESKQCNCKKSLCLKLYCECFAAGGFCGPQCACVNCNNAPGHEQAIQQAKIQILARSPTAFDPKMHGERQNKKGCRCRKTRCLKKYCECFQAGMPCGEACRCESCGNVDPHTGRGGGGATPAAVRGLDMSQQQVCLGNWRWMHE